MDTRSVKDLLPGVALAGLGVYIAMASAQYSYLTDEGPGPGFLPFWLGIAILSLALCLLVANRLGAAAPNTMAKLSSWTAESRALSAWIALMATILLSPTLGFAVSLMLLTVFIIACLERRSLWSAVVVALGLGIGFHLIFVVLLGVSLPTSILGF
jgi:putative tricarboxylic transport membrane protein